MQKVTNSYCCSHQKSIRFHLYWLLPSSPIKRWITYPSTLQGLPYVPRRPSPKHSWFYIWLPVWYHQPKNLRKYPVKSRFHSKENTKKETFRTFAPLPLWHWRSEWRPRCLPGNGRAGRHLWMKKDPSKVTKRWFSKRYCMFLQKLRATTKSWW